VLPGVAPANAYPTADGRAVVIAANADAVFARLATAIGRPEWATDARYARHAARGAHQVELDEEIARWTVAHPAAGIVDLLRAHAVPVGLINTAPDLAVDDHIAARDMIVRLAAGFERAVPMAGVVPKLARTPGSIRSVGPALGEHTDVVLHDLASIDDAEIASLRADGVIA
jgi:crotonobetainyl-CoA:carnitine CoA-transferase CaiB-like acyl-CoA transferase